MGSLWVNCSAVQGNRRRSMNVRVEEEALGTTGGLRARRADT